MDIPGMRRHLLFDVAGSNCAATLDEASGRTGLLIVSGGNEIRSGAHGGQAAMARHFSAMGFPVFRYDRRGIGDSEGDNGGFDTSGEDMAAAIAAFRAAAPGLKRIVGFGNCDAASALALFHAGLRFDAVMLANPWVIEQDTEAIATGDQDTTSAPSAAAIRARYWARLKNPRSLIDLLTGRIDLKKLAGGLLKAAKKEAPTGLAQRMAQALEVSEIPVAILLARRDTTALAFASAWKDPAFARLRGDDKISLSEIDSASHSFAGAADRDWLYDQIAESLKATG